MNPIIKINNLTKVFDGIKIIDRLNLEVYSNEILVIMGASGAGKTSLLNIIGQLDRDYQGEIVYASDIFQATHVPFPYVFQDSESLLPWKTVIGNIKIGNQHVEEDELENILESLSLSEHRHKFPYQLSGGMKQRVGIARGLVCHSKMMLMDEPFSNLDAVLRKKLQELVRLIREKRDMTVIFVTHDEEEAQRVGDRIIRI